MCIQLSYNITSENYPNSGINRKQLLLFITCKTGLNRITLIVYSPNTDGYFHKSVFILGTMILRRCWTVTRMDSS